MAKKRPTPDDLKRDALKRAFGSIMSESAGRMVMWEILDSTGVNAECIGIDTHETYRLLGRREVGLTLMEWLALFPEPFAKMFTENRPQELKQQEESDAGSESDA